MRGTPPIKDTTTDNTSCNRIYITTVINKHMPPTGKSRLRFMMLKIE
jgi:hypothetical protein